jgi:hypothetical protein
MTRYLLLFDSYGLVFFFVGHPLWREDGSVFCIRCWPLPAQSFSSPSPLELPTIFYCLRFETSLFVASYDSQGHGGGIRPRLHTGMLFLDLRSVSFGLLYSTVGWPKTPSWRVPFHVFYAPVANVFVPTGTALLLVFISVVTSVICALSREPVSLSPRQQYGTVDTEPLPNNGRPLWLRYSGF